MSNEEVRLDESINKRHSIDNQSRTYYNFKVIMLGEISVGKTSLLKRFIDKEFTKEYKCTIGVELRLKTIDINDSVSAELKIWDTCGAEKYRVITHQYYRDAPGIILVFDLTNKESFSRLGEWLINIQSYAPENCTVLLIGNKSDMIEKRTVSKESIEDFCRNNDNLSYIEASALNGTKVNHLFFNMAKKLVEKEKRIKGINSFINTLNSPLASTMLTHKMRQMSNEATCCS